MSISEEIAELKRCAGSQFAPFIVSEFLGMLKEASPEEVKLGNAAENPEDVHTEYSAAPDSGQVEHSRSVHPIPYSRYLLDESMRIVSVDENFEKLTGYTQEDLWQSPMCQADLIPEEERTEYLCQTNASLSKNP